jgi:hypothetical protein
MMLRPSPVRLAALALLVTTVSGCGAQTTAAPDQAPTETADAAISEPSPRLIGPHCLRVGESPDGLIRLCPYAEDHGRFVLGKRPTARELEIQSPTTVPSGHWTWAAISPDGSSLLAQWTAECEVPVAFFVSLESGSPSVVTGGRDWADSPESFALGWTTDGKAIVFLPEGPSCGTGAKRAGVYIYDDEGEGERVVATKPHAGSPVQPSIPARDIDTLVP